MERFINYPAIIKNMVVSYERAKIYFPKYLKSNPKEFQCSIPRWGWEGYDNKLLFKRKGFAISAHFSDSTAPRNKPLNLIDAIDIVAKDLVPAENLLAELEKLVVEGITDDMLRYKRAGPSDFRIYDFSSKQYPDVLKNMLLVAEADETRLVQDYQELRKFAGFIGKPDKTEFDLHIKGKTLREAVERALLVYKNAVKVSPLGEAVEKMLKTFQNG